MPMLDAFDYPVPVDDVPIEDEHSGGKLFCWNPTCTCHEDDLLIHQVYLFFLDGLMTAHEAADFVAGKGI